MRLGALFVPGWYGYSGQRLNRVYGAASGPGVDLALVGWRPQRGLGSVGATEYNSNPGISSTRLAPCNHEIG